MTTTNKTITLSSGKRVMRGTRVIIINTYCNDTMVTAERVKDGLRFTTYKTDIAVASYEVTA